MSLNEATKNENEMNEISQSPIGIYISDLLLLNKNTQSANEPQTSVLKNQKPIVTTPSDEKIPIMNSPVKIEEYVNKASEVIIENEVISVKAPAKPPRQKIDNLDSTENNKLLDGSKNKPQASVIVNQEAIMTPSSNLTTSLSTIIPPIKLEEEQNKSKEAPIVFPNETISRAVIGPPKTPRQEINNPESKPAENVSLLNPNKTIEKPSERRKDTFFQRNKTLLIAIGVFLLIVLIIAFIVWLWLRNANGFGVPCNQTSDCKKISDLGFVCENRVCACKSNSYFNESECLLKKSYGQKCLKDLNCDDTKNLKCTSDRNVCDCSNSLEWDHGSCQIPKAQLKPIVLLPTTKESTSIISIIETILTKSNTPIEDTEGPEVITEQETLSVESTSEPVRIEDQKSEPIELTTTYMPVLTTQVDYFTDLNTPEKTLKTHKESCENNFDCDQSVSLVCADATRQCECPTEHFWDTINLLCVKEKNYRDACVSSDQCKEHSGMVCKNGMCRCQEYFGWNAQQGVCDVNEYKVDRYEHGEKNKLGSCAEFLRINDLSECCPSRDDTCYMHNGDIKCYCDKSAGIGAKIDCEDSVDVCGGGHETSNNTDNSGREDIKNSKTYGEDCVDNSECDATKLLICPDKDGECDCPLLSNAFMCDCPKGHFWDGSCLPLRSHGEICNKEVDYECIHSAGLHCTGTCTCRLSEHRWDSDSKKCVPVSIKSTDNDDYIIDLFGNNGACERDGKEYAHLDIIDDNCNKCECQNGIWTCDSADHPCLINPVLINQINSAGLSWEAGNYSKWWGKTLKYGFKYQLGTKLGLENRVKIVFRDGREDIEVPESYDFRNDADVVDYLRDFPIRDQGECAASWAFSTIDVATDRLVKEKREYFKNKTFSVQHVISCSLSSRDGCMPMSVDVAWGFLDSTLGNAKGAVEESCYEYTDGGYDEQQIRETSLCKKNHDCQTTLLKTTPVYELRVESDEDIQREILMKGPVQAVFKVYPDFFIYKSGVYESSLENISDSISEYHSVKLLGWGFEKGVAYWLCANSWGEGWGENGYFRIRRGAHEINDHIHAALINL